MSARVHIEQVRSPGRRVGFGSQPESTHRVSVHVSYDLGHGDAALADLDHAVDEAKAAIRQAER